MSKLGTAILISIVLISANSATAQSSSNRADMLQRQTPAVSFLPLEQITLSHTDNFVEALSVMQRKLTDCWKPPKDYQATVSFRIKINNIGSVISKIAFEGNSAISRADQALAERVISSCSPYTFPLVLPDSDLFDIHFRKGIVVVQSQAVVPNKWLAVWADDRRAAPLSADEINVITKAVRECWKAPNNITKDFEVRFSFDRNGYVIDTRSPETRNAKLALDVASQIKRCEPFKFPSEKYIHWKHLEMLFIVRDVQK